MSERVPEDWSTVQLNNISEFRRGTTYASSELSEDKLSFPLYINMKSFKVGGGYSAPGDKFYTPTYKQTQRVQENDLLIANTDVTSSCDILGAPLSIPERKMEKDVLFSHHVTALRLSKNVDKSFLFYLLCLGEYRIRMQSYGRGTTVKMLDSKEFGRLFLSLPPLPEQKKIASILTSVDEVIDNTQKQIDKLQDLKKATMNELLTKGIGHTQFKDSQLGRIPKSWEVVSLSKVATNLDSKRIPLKSSDRQDIQGIYRYFGASGVIDYVNDYLFDGEYILLGEDGENVISRNLPLAFIVRGKFWVNNHAHIFQPINGVNIGFLCEYLESLDYTNVASGSAQPKITKSSLNGVKIKLPSFEEQEKIAHVLTSIDKNIREQQRKLQQIQSLKKSLMQDLLTGKVRVTV